MKFLASPKAVFLLARTYLYNLTHFNINNFFELGFIYIYLLF